MEPAPDFAAAGLLDGLEGDERQARVELLEQLHEAGASVEEMRRAVAEDRLPLLPVEIVLRREEVYTAREVAEEAGLPLDLLLRVQQAFGMPVLDPDAKAFSDAGLAAARRQAAFREFGLPEDGMIEVTRVMGQSMSRIADAIRALVGEAAAPEAGSERDLGLRYMAAMRELMPQVGPLLLEALTAHLLEQVRSDVVSRAEVAAGGLPGARDVTVAFADLVGFTRLGESRAADELGAVAERLSEMAEAVARPPVKLVKTIGDAAMLVSPQAAPLLGAALDLVAAADEESEEFPQLKVGLAAGPALSRSGDWYGHTVNLASRVTGVARPGSVLATEAVHDAADDEFLWSFAGERRLKNIRETVRLFRARRVEAG